MAAYYNDRIPSLFIAGTTSDHTQWRQSSRLVLGSEQHENIMLYAFTQHGQVKITQVTNNSKVQLPPIELVMP